VRHGLVDEEGEDNEKQKYREQLMLEAREGKWRVEKREADEEGLWSC
jgi:hypothetical protein